MSRNAVLVIKNVLIFNMMNVCINIEIFFVCGSNNNFNYNIICTYTNIITYIIIDFFVSSLFRFFISSIKYSYEIIVKYSYCYIINVFKQDGLLHSE